MTMFSYKATDQTGKEVSGEVFSPTKDELVAELEKSGLFLNSWKEITDLTSPEGAIALPSMKRPWAQILADAWKTRRRSGYTDYRQIRGHLNYKTLATITWQTSIGLKSGITLTEMLSTISRETPDEKIRFVYNFLFEKINAGHNFADALSYFPGIFSPIYVSLVRAGEAGGFLAMALEEAAAYLKKQDRLNKKIRSMLIYPVMLTVIASSILIFMVTYIMPVFLDLFTSLNAELPLVTRILLFLFWLFKKFILLWAALLVVFAYYSRKAYKALGSNRAVDSAVLRMPAIGPLMLKIALSRFLGTMSVLLKSGVNILEALAIGKAVAGNAALAREIESISTAVQAGKTLAEKMARSRFFPSMVTMMVANGEKSGNLSEALEKVSEYYVEEVDIAISDTLSMLEPLIVVFMGFFIALIATGLLIPIFELPGYVE